MEQAVDFDWQPWFARWETMQDAYVVRRRERFRRIVHSPGLPANREVRILDLGCGPGSLSFAALERFPRAEIVAVDADPVLLAMGCAVAGARLAQITFRQVDLRDGDWWAEYKGAFDLVVSTTALHWLTATHLHEVYCRIYTALRPGGWFKNADHIAADDPATQDRYRALLQIEQEAALARPGVDTWDGFWAALNPALAAAGLPTRPEAAHWEGSDDGLPRAFHLATLRACSFRDVAFHWQYLGEALLVARKGSTTDGPRQFDHESHE